MEVTRGSLRHWNSMRVDKTDAPSGFALKVTEIVRGLIKADVVIEEDGQLPGMKQSYFSWRFRRAISEPERLRLLEALRVRWPDPTDRTTWCWYGTETITIVNDAVAMNQYVNGHD